MINLDKTKVLTQIIGFEGDIRSNSLCEELSLQGIEFMVTPAVRLAEHDFYAEKYHSKLISSLICLRDINSGEVGCALAHKSAALNLISSEFEFGLIFEDDAVITKEIDFSVLKSALSQPDPTIIFLGWLPGHAVSLNSAQSTNRIVELVTPATCAFAYALNRQAAALIANSSSKIIDVADWPIYLFEKIKFCAVRTPWANAPQNPNLSLIGVRAPNIDFSLTGRIKNICRLILSIFVIQILTVPLKLNLTWSQIFHRLVLRDFVLKIGKSKSYSKNLSGPYPTEDVILVRADDLKLRRFFWK